MSLALQATPKALIPSFFFQKLDNLQPNESAAALLVWAALPVSTSIDFENGEIKQFRTDKDVFWNFPDPDLRKAAVFDGRTTQSLRVALATARERLLDAGDSKFAAFFTPDNAGFFQGLATNSFGDQLLQSLLFTEAEMVNGAASTLKDVQASSFSIIFVDIFHHRKKSRLPKRLRIYLGWAGETRKSYNLAAAKEWVRLNRPVASRRIAQCLRSLLF